jgi:hypothetical protein
VISSFQNYLFSNATNINPRKLTIVRVTLHGAVSEHQAIKVCGGH